MKNAMSNLEKGLICADSWAELIAFIISGRSWLSSRVSDTNMAEFCGARYIIRTDDTEFHTYAVVEWIYHFCSDWSVDIRSELCDKALKIKPGQTVCYRDVAITRIR